MSERQDNQATQSTPREDELLGVIADVEKQLSNLKTFRNDREEARQRLEKREAELSARQQEIAALASKLDEQQQEVTARLRTVESGETHLRTQREQLERDLKALAEEQNQTQQERQRAAAELEHQTRLLAQREQRLSESAAALSRQREDLESQAGTLAQRQKDFDKAHVESERMRAELEQLRAACEEAKSLARTREEDLNGLQKQAQDLIAQVAAARAQSQEAQARTEQLKAELTRSNEAQSSLMAELSAREEKLQAKRDKLRILADELQKRTTASESLEQQLENFKRQLIERDSRVQDLSQKLAAATGKLREISQTFQEQAEIIAEADSLKQELDSRQERIGSLEKDLARAQSQLQNARAAGPKADNRVAELTERVEALEEALGNAQSELKQALAENRSLAEQLTDASGAGAATHVPNDIGEAVALRWSRLRWMRNALSDQAAKLNQAGESLRERFEECERILAQRDSIATANAALSESRKKLERLHAQASKTKAAGLVFYALLSAAILGGLSWVIAGQIAPATYAATAILAADTRGAQASEDQLAEWQRFHETLVTDPRVIEVAADRMARRGIISLGTPGQLQSFLSSNFSSESPAPGQLTLELRGQSATRLTRILDTYVAAVSSQANAGKERRADGLGTTVVTVANTGPGPISDPRLLYAVGVFAGGLALSLCFVVLIWKRLANSKVKFEEAQLVDAALAESSWKQASDAIPVRR